MEVTRMSISQETQSRLVAHPISKSHRRQIRIDGVKALIRQSKQTQKLSVLDLMNAAGYRAERPNTQNYWAGYAFIVNLIKRGVIIKNDKSRRRSTYCLPEDIKTTPIETNTVDHNVATPKELLKPATDRVQNASKALAEEIQKLNDLGDVYTVEFKITRRNGNGEFGNKNIGEIKVSDVSKETVRHLVNNLLDHVG